MAAQRCSVGSTAPSSAGMSPSISPMYSGSTATAGGNRGSSPITRASIVSSASSSRCSMSICSGVGRTTTSTNQQQQQQMICSPGAVVNVLQALYKLSYSPPAALILAVCQFMQVPTSKLPDLTSQALVALLTAFHWSLSEVLDIPCATDQHRHPQLTLPPTPSMSTDRESLVAVLRSTSFSTIVRLAASEMQTRIHDLEIADVLAVLRSFASIMSAEEVDAINNEGILRGVQEWLTPRIHTFKPEEISALLEILEKFGPDSAPLATLTPRRERALLPSGLTDTPPTNGGAVSGDLQGSVLFANQNDPIVNAKDSAPGYTPRMHLTPGRGYPMW
ncbi:hypothetical protein FOZ63_027799 [Perkinsus olseni]|uniref:Uncharacterized protein n=2 Tax=Perkinsus olseni TaxID=32597 RepID=A0A7J6TYZ2_PEROL|nr:hypothetical protein FOZ63_027799 [Perkinsus olseni]